MITFPLRVQARRLLLGLVFGVLGAGVADAADSPDGLWRDVGESSIALRAQPRQIVPATYRTLMLEQASLRVLLARVPLEDQVPVESSGEVLSLPLPEGGFGRFRIVESPIMEPALAAKFPELRTYLGQGVDDPTATLRFDVTPRGFHAQILSVDGTSYVDPFQPGDTEHYIAYRKRDARTDAPRSRCLVTGEALSNDDGADAKRGVPAKISSGTTRRAYRLAMAATGEYTAFHGGSVAQAMAAIATTVNRVNGIYERDLAVRMILVANNNLIVYTNGATDPYTNNNGSTMLGQNQTNIGSVIGSANYDIGHVVSTGGGGVAALGSVCSAGNKARGVTGSSAPVGDGFDVDYVAHEIGHQFGGNHTFNGVADSCGGGNRNASTAYEPGSGSTIQAYAGICGADDLQPHSDDYFHRASLNEMLIFTTTGGGAGCATTSATGNTPPTVTTAAAFTIPRQTRFVLTATGSDANGDTLTYLWEQFNLGSANSAGSLTDNGGPLFRNFTPATSPQRTFPRQLPAGTWELLPSTNRTLGFRVTARDNRASGGGTNEATTAVTVTTSAGPFVVTAPNTAVTWNAANTQTVTWNVANTTAAPVSTATVRILLSLDGGATWPLVLASGEANDGSTTLTLTGATPTTQARIRVEAENNIYFDTSDVNFTITGTAPTAGVTLTQSGGATSVIEGGATDSYTLVLNSQPTGNVVITTTPDAQVSTSPSALTFTAGNWNVAQTVTVTAVDDALAEGAHSGSITHAASGGGYGAVTIASVTASITDDDVVGVTVAPSGGNTSVTEGGATDTYSLVLTSQPTANVVITASPSAQLTVTPASLTFTAGNWNVAQTVVVTAVDDAVAEGAHLGNISHAASGGGYGAVTISSVTANITDNDVAGVTVTPSAGSTSVVEGGATDTYSLVLTSQPTANVVVTATPNAQVTVTPSSLTFTAGNWNIAQTVSVAAVDDALAEGAHAGGITHAASGGGYAAVTIASVAVNITDNDFSIGGVVSGLAGSGLVLRNNGAGDLPIAANGPFTFAATQTTGTGYAITVFASPTQPTQSCEIAPASGTVTTNISVQVTCTTSATQIAFGVQPSDTPAAAAIQPSVTVRFLDSLGNPVTSGSTVNMALGSNTAGGVLSGTLSAAPVSGVATFSSLHIDTTGSGYTLSASASGVAAVTSTPFSITADVPALLDFDVQPTSTSSGAVIAPAVRVRVLDAQGNPTISTAVVTLAIAANPSAGVLDGTTSVAAIAGVAQFDDLSIDDAGLGYTLRATSGALTEATSDAFDIREDRIFRSGFEPL